MADLTADTYHRLPKAYQHAVTLWLFEHGIDGLACSRLTMDEGRFDAHMYEYDDSAEHRHSIIVDSVGNPVITVKRIDTSQPLDGNIVRRWLQLEREGARRG